MIFQGLTSMIVVAPFIKNSLYNLAVFANCKLHRCLSWLILDSCATETEPNVTISRMCAKSIFIETNPINVMSFTPPWHLLWSLYAYPGVKG